MCINFFSLIFFIFTLLKSLCCHSNNSSECQSEPYCLKCGATGCIKCPNLIVHPSRKCVNICPFGHKTKWSNKVDYMGQMCVKSITYMGLSADAASILTGVVCGTVLSMFIVILAFFYVKRRRAELPQITETCSDMEDYSPERRDFLKQFEILRPYANTFLEMLNDTRRHIREFHRDGDNTAVAAYKPIIRDLAKILILLNRPIDTILTIPPDWEHLYNWCEKTLKRYKMMSDNNQYGKLINFLQSPIGEPDGCSRASTTMSTFKPDDAPLGSSLSLQEYRAKYFGGSCESDFNSPLNPQWQFKSSSEFIASRWKNGKDYFHSQYFIEDDFVQLGLRPQDEITTEL